MHATTIHVRWGELDPYHHVNHATYLSYLEHARISALDSIGWGMDQLSEGGFQVVVARATVSFRRPATAGEVLTVASWVEEIRGASSVWRQQITTGDGVVLDSEILAAMTGPDGRPRRMPPEFRAALQQLMRGPAGVR